MNPIITGSILLDKHIQLDIIKGGRIPETLSADISGPRYHESDYHWQHSPRQTYTARYHKGGGGRWLVSIAENSLAAIRGVSTKGNSMGMSTTWRSAMETTESISNWKIFPGSVQGRTMRETEAPGQWNSFVIITNGAQGREVRWDPVN